MNSKFRIVPDRVSIVNYKIKYLGGEEYKQIAHLIPPSLTSKINPTDVYEVELDGKVYFHVREIEDGDFVGIDLQGIFYKITSDPYEIVALEVEDLTEYFN
ncbi:hypothetical protein ACE38W_13580 [Chitinophaga sp. Hz27]|uniref:hypothetical protein n=1 Tax=Chitinophaga sp. Hz27 TaxID=3347169 RepID=UPI0035DEEFC4